MKRICIAFKGLLSPKNVLRVISVSAAHAVLSWKDKKFWMLWKMDFPVKEMSSAESNLGSSSVYLLPPLGG